jgi:Amt family ammonium transporter
MAGMQVTLDVQKVDAVFFMYCATLVFAMQIGFALLEVGSVSIRNTKSVLVKNVVDLCASGVAYYAVGYGLAWGAGEDGFAGRDGFGMRSAKFDSANHATAAGAHANAFFSACFAATSATIVSGAVAERFPFQSYAVLSSVVAGVIFPIVSHWAWAENGWANPVRGGGRVLFDVGVLDYAGSGVVHVTGGLCALWAVYVVGARAGRFSHGRQANDMPQQNPVYQVIGGMLMWYGWFGFNCGSVRTLAEEHLITVARVGLVTALSGCLGGITVVCIDMYRDRSRVRPARMINGILTALVSSSGGAAFVEIGVSLVIGVVAGVLYVWASDFMVRKKLDDVVDAVAVHFFGGIWGIVASALFSAPKFLKHFYGDSYKGCGLLYGCSHGGAVFGAALVFLLALCAWVSVTALAVLAVLKYFNALRVSADRECNGLDRSMHGGSSYTEFQTTIFRFKDKSGSESQMEMRVRAGDAARFAMVLSEIMETEAKPTSVATSRRSSTSDGSLTPSPSQSPGRSSAPLLPGDLGSLGEAKLTITEE